MQTIYLDISNKGVIPKINAKQSEVGRKFLAVLTDSGVPFIVPNDAVFSVWYDGKSGKGNYSDNGQDYAVLVNGNKITVELIEQMLKNAGDGVLSILINSADGKQIGLWNIDYSVEAVPGIGSEKAEEYYTAFSKATSELAQSASMITQNQNRIDSLIQAKNKTAAGLIYPLAAEKVPDGFLLCDGAEYSRFVYKELFEAIGTTYGEGNGSTTFNVPNLATRVPVGAGDNYDLGDTGGEENHTLSVEELPSYSISIPGRVNSTSGGSGAFEYSGNWPAETTYSIESGGSGQAHNIMQPYTVVNYIISTGKEIEYVVAGGGVVSNFISIDGDVFNQYFDDERLNAGSMYLLTSDAPRLELKKGDIVLAKSESAFSRQLNIVGESGKDGTQIIPIKGDELDGLAMDAQTGDTEFVIGTLYLTTTDTHPLGNAHINAPAGTLFLATGIDTLEEQVRLKGADGKDYVLTEADKKEIAQLVPSADYTNLLHLPEKYNLVVGDTFELFYKGIMLCKNPYDYNILVTCPIGKNWSRKFEVTPDKEGIYALKIAVSDDSGNMLDEQTTQLVVAKKDIKNAGQLNVLCVGDSLTSGGQWVGEFYRRLTNTNAVAPNGNAAPTGDGLANINFVGTCAKYGAGYEGYGGWTFASYLNTSKSSENYWVSCTHSKTDHDQESIYKDANDVLWQLETIEANRIKFKPYEGEGAMPSSGTLTWVSGGIDTFAITYTAITQEKGSPFVYNGAVDFAAYCADLGIDTIHQCYILLGWNNTTTEADTYKAQAKQFIDLLLAFNPNMKIVLVGLQIPSLDGCGNDYGAKGTLANFRALQEYVFNLDNLYKEIADEYENVESINLSGQFDTDYNCISSELPVNNRNSKTVTTQTNGVHPSTQGYYQIADAVYRKFYDVYEKPDLLGLDNRTAVFREGQVTQATTAKEMSPDKIYYFDGRAGTSLGSGYTTSLNGLELTKDSIKFTADATGSGVNLNAYGLSVPLALEDGKTYTISARRKSNSAHALNLLTFAKGDNDMWTYEKFNAASHIGNNVYSRTVTTEAGKGYALLFTLTSADNNVLCEFVDISIAEAE